MITQKQKPPFPWTYIILFSVISFCVIIFGLFYYNNQKKNLLSEMQIELSVIANLKIRQITQWRMERIGDGRFMGNNIALVRKYSEYIRDPSDLILQREILQNFKLLKTNFDYGNIFLIDSQANIVMSYPDVDNTISEHQKLLVSGIIKGREVVFTDIENEEKLNDFHIDMMVPLIDHDDKDSSVIGILNICVDPQIWLYPLLQTWPTSSKSAETLLIKQEGDEIFFLNNLRHIDNENLMLRKPVSDELLPSSMAVRGIKGTLYGIDYRNEPVVAAMARIPGTEWFMVSKIDRDEVFIVLNNQMRIFVLILVLFLSSIGLFLGFLSWNQRARFYREKYEIELNQMALVKHFDYILKFANDIILLIDSKLNIVEANDRAFETYMYSRSEFIGMKLENIRAPETLSQISEQIRIVDENESATFETYHKRRDNTIFPVEISTRMVTIEGIRYYQSIGRDITERKLAEENLISSELKFRKIFEESPFCMIMTGKDFGILKANYSFCKMLGYQEEELKDFTFRNFTHPDNIEADEIALMRMIAQEIPMYSTEKRYLCKDKSIVWGSTTVSIIRNTKGEVEFFLVMVEDITQRKKSESDLIAAKEKAEESDRLKTAFLHNVSHEIRTPMNAIIGFSTLMNEPDLAESERKQYGDIIFQSSNQLLSIINDIVDIANIESEQMKLNLDEINLNAVLMNLKDQFSYKDIENNVPIFVSAGLPDDESIITTDSTKLIQILSNLINNAIKFTKKGRIDFGYEQKEKYLEFFVRDTGIGVSSDNLDKIFQRFYQVDSTESRQFGGTGLGLSICKAYVELLGGNIGVTSKVGEGTIFRFTIPV